MARFNSLRVNSYKGFSAPLFSVTDACVQGRSANDGEPINGWVEPVCVNLGENSQDKQREKKATTKKIVKPQRHRNSITGGFF